MYFNNNPCYYSKGLPKSCFVSNLMTTDTTSMVFHFIILCRNFEFKELHLKMSYFPYVPRNSHKKFLPQPYFNKSKQAPSKIKIQKKSYASTNYIMSSTSKLQQPPFLSFKSNQNPQPPIISNQN